MRNAPLALAATGLLLLAYAPARAQVPFFNGNAGIFDPEISVVNSGVVLDAQAVVSADRKYVTLTTRFQQAQLLDLQEFAFQTGGGVAGGQVGGRGAAGGAAQGNVAARGRAAGTSGAAGAGSIAPQANQPATSLHPNAGKAYPVPGKPTPTARSVLEQQGMTLVGRVTPPAAR
jgi:hypothetical protein